MMTTFDIAALALGLAVLSGSALVVGASILLYERKRQADLSRLLAAFAALLWESGERARGRSAS